jgi:hypothetical protein
MVLSAIRRPFLQRMPLILINGNISGAGKGKVCNALATIGYGVRGDMMTAGENDEEFQKRIDSMLIDGAPVVTLDNANGRLIKGDQLASIATEGKARIRAYGRKGGDFTVEGRPLIMINGNGVAPSEDMVRRVLVVRVATDSVDPELKRFAFDPVAEARLRRAEILTAAFTLMRWWRLVPSAPGTVMGSFEEWSFEVGDLVQALTGWHPAMSIHANKNSDPVREHQRAALQALHDRFGEIWFRASDVESILKQVAHAQRMQFEHTAVLKGFEHPSLSAEELARVERDLAEAIPLVTEYGRGDAKSIGDWFRKMANATPGGFVVYRDTKDQRTARVTVRKRDP